jgi:hypothetical protein
MNSGIIKIVLIILGSALFTFYLWGNNLDARWGVIDDHEIIEFMGSDGKVKLNELNHLLLSTEVGQPGKSLRYRPSFYLLRIIETFLWGDSPFLWYFIRLILFAGTAAIVWWLVGKWIGFLPAMLFVLYVLSFHFWGDIWTRLGASETYAVFGIAVYCLGCINMLRHAREKDLSDASVFLNWSLIVTGAFIAMGSKENFLILLISSVILSVMLWKRHILGKIGFICSVVIFSYGIFIATAVLLALSKTKKDMYGDSVELLERLQFIYKGLMQLLEDHYLLLMIFAFVSLVCIIAALFIKQRNEDQAKRMIKVFSHYSIVAVVMVLFYLSQYFFYSGKLPSGMRYDFPGVLAGPFFLLASVVFLLNCFRSLNNQKILNRAVLVIFSMLMIVLITNNGYSSLRQKSQINVLQTTEQNRRLTAVVNSLIDDPGSDLVFHCYNPMDAEIVFSISKFLRFNRVKSKFYLKVYDFPKDYTASDLEENLIGGLYAVSKNGNKNFTPISELEKSSNTCYSLRFSRGFFSPPELLFAHC